MFSKIFKTLICLFIILTICLNFKVAYAQPEPPPPPTYTVQSGDTLADIAIRFNTTVVELLRANDISDPNFLYEGMILTIPNLEEVSGDINSNIVPIGSSLRHLVIDRYISLDEISRINKLTSASQVYAGASLILAQTAEDISANPVPTRLSLLELSANQQISPWVIILSIQQPDRTMLLPGDYYPGTIDQASATTNLYSSIVQTMDIHPLPLVQGQTTVVRIKTTEPVQLEGNLAGNNLFFVQQDANEYIALQGIHAMHPVGLSEFSLSITASYGDIYSISQPILVAAGKFRSDQRLIVDPATIDRANTEPEDILVRNVISQFTTNKLWSDPFIVPIDVPPGVYADPTCVTDRFGNRRAYNDGDFDYFHTGLDLTTCGNTLNIYATAPGRVVMAEELVVRGNFTLIDHGWGVFSGYGHQLEMFVKEGDYVEAGQLIGFVGKTGRVTGPHLHWEIWVNGIQVNPTEWLDNQYP